MTYDKSAVAAVVVHYDSVDTLRLTLENLSQVFDRTHILVVDNSSSLNQESLEGLATIIDDHENLGYAGGVNRGFEVVSERLPSVKEVLVCTHETIFEANAVKTLIATASDYPEGHIVGPRLVTTDGDGLRTIWSNGGSLRLPLFYPKHNRSSSRKGVASVDWVDGAAFLIDVHSYNRIGGIPEEFFMYMEDVALGLRARSLNVPVLVNLEAIVEQSANGPSRALAIRNRTILAIRYMEPLQGRVVQCEIFLRQLLLRFSPSQSNRAKSAESRTAVRDAVQLCAQLPGLSTGGPLRRPIVGPSPRK